MTNVAAVPTEALLTYEAYMAEPEVKGRYDIVDGVRVFQPEVSWERQNIIGNFIGPFHDFERSHRVAKFVAAPFDLLIRRLPRLQIRQPDLLFISHSRLAQGGGPPAIGPLQVAPELVVEIISTRETQHILGDKVADYCAIGVEEAWVVRPETRAVEVLELTPGGSRPVAVYDDTQTAVSRVFPGLVVPVADVFAP